MTSRLLVYQYPVSDRVNGKNKGVTETKLEKGFV